MREFILSPSILSADFSKLGEDIAKLDENNIKYIHIDVMDGLFVPSISFGMPVIASIRNKTKAIFDVHLMIEEPARYIEEFKKVGADIITVHVEACKHLNRTLAMIKQAGLKVGVALNPSTPLTELEYQNLKIEYDYPKTVNSPVKNNQEIGKIAIYTQNNLIFEEKIYTINSVD